MSRKYQWILWIVSALWLGAQAQADVIAVGPDAFPAGATTITFNGLADGTEVNGLTVNGVRFTYTVNGSPLNGAVQIDGGRETPTTSRRQTSSRWATTPGS